jgi:ABC-type hemin transport system substrate-binding protein
MPCFFPSLYFYKVILQKTSDLNYIPKRIISLVPSQTELLHYLGLEQETIGITKFCVHPREWFRNKKRVGGTKAINLKTINDLHPDLIIANKEENVKEQVEELAKHYPVWITDVNNLNDALEMINDIGQLTGKQNSSASLTDSIKKKFNDLNQLQTSNFKPQTCYLIWQNPYMTIGADTFINDMLSRCSFQNAFSDKKRYPEVTIPQLQSRLLSGSNLKLLLLSSEPFPFKQKHIDELQQQLPDCKIMLVDGEMFSWYGSRLLHAPGYFKKLLENLGQQINQLTD